MPSHSSIGWGALRGIPMCAPSPHLHEYGGEHSKAFNQLIVIDAALALLDELM
jgi:hypothetical protein